jgi:carbon-monoxide dehydrogenase small subunit
VLEDGHRITTGEGLVGSVVQQACLERHSFQCGFYPPGFLAVITELLDEEPNPTEEGARRALSGNICRCTGYRSIVEGLLRASELRA